MLTVLLSVGLAVVGGDVALDHLAKMVVKVGTDSLSNRLSYTFMANCKSIICCMQSDTQLQKKPKCSS